MPRRRSNRSPLWQLPVNREVEEELQFHLDMRIREYVDAGMDEDEARRRALERFGDPRRHAASCRHQARGRNRRWRAFQLMDEVRLDLAFALRLLLRRPLLTSSMVGLLALGLGATTAVTVLADRALLQPLPFQDPESLVTLWEHQTVRGKTKNVASPANFLAWEEETSSFVEMAAFVTVSGNLTGDEGPPQRIRVRLATGGFLHLLGRPPVLGRLLSDQDHVEGAEPVVMLSHRLWRQRFGGRRDVIEQTVTMNGEEYGVAGVLPPDIRLDLGPALSPYGDAADVIAPLPVSQSWREPRGRWLMVLARLAPGVTVEGAQADLATVMARQQERHPRFNTDWEAQTVPLAEHLREPLRVPLLALLGAVVLVLLIVCMNVSSLMVSRTLGRSTELAVRQALGAGGRRLARQLLVEGMVIVLTAGALAWVLAHGALRLAVATLPPALLPSYGGDGLAGTWLVALALAGLCLLFFGLFPGLTLARRLGQLAHSMSLEGWLVGKLPRNRLRAALVFGQVVVTLVLLVGAGLMMRTVRGLLGVDPGFQRQGIVSFAVAPGDSLEDAQVFPFFERLLERLAGLGQVSSVGAVTHLPMASVGAATSYFPTDRPEPEPGQLPVADIRILQGDYLGTMGIPLLAGRAFDSRDRAGQPGTVLVSESLARRYWPGESALEREVYVHWGEPGQRQVVGVVGDVYHADLLSAPRDAIYFPQDQEPQGLMNVVLRTGGEVDALAPSLRQAVAELDETLPIFDLRRIEAVVDDTVSQQRFLAAVLGVLALSALVLAALGIYGVTALSVTQSTREIGLRMALGASPWEVARMFLRRVALWTGSALALGLAASVLLGRTVESLFFGVRATDPATLVTTAAVLALAAVIAALVPARRAARLDPTRALRWE